MTQMDLCGAEWWPPRNGDGSYGEPPQYCDQPAGHDGDHWMPGGTSWPQDNDDDSVRGTAAVHRDPQDQALWDSLYRTADLMDEAAARHGGKADR
jgi:hypothetical protein